MLGPEFKMAIRLVISEVITPPGWKPVGFHEGQQMPELTVRFGLSHFAPAEHRKQFVGKKFIYFLTQDYEGGLFNGYWFPFYGYWNMTYDVSRLDEVREAIKNWKLEEKPK